MRHPAQVHWLVAFHVKDERVLFHSWPMMKEEMKKIEKFLSIPARDVSDAYVPISCRLWAEFDDEAEELVLILEAS